VALATKAVLALAALMLATGPMPGSETAGAVLVVGGEGRNCNEDPQCINRLHPDIPMVALAMPGQTILLRARNASDFDLDPESDYDDPRLGDPQFGTVHPLTGPIDIDGAQPGDALAVTLLDIAPGRFGYTSISGIGFVTDRIEGPLRVLWRLDRDDAVSDGIPGVRIPNRSFPGVVTVLPGPKQHAAMLEREAALAAAGGKVYLPHALHATPAALCGPEGSAKDECLRTIPPREHGGNMDIRHLGVGVTIYLPCYVEGCGLAVGDLHYAQGDGEVAGTAIEMDADVMLTTRLVKGGGRGMTTPRYEGPSTLLDIPSRRFYATTGFPLKGEGETPPDMAYLESPHVPGLANLSKDISLAARNALLEMIDYIATTKGMTRQQAYIVASVAVDLRIGQLVDAPNVGVTAILPLDIFESGMASDAGTATGSRR
jgi:formamidase